MSIGNRIQLAVNIQTPQMLGGLDGGAVYIGKLQRDHPKLFVKSDGWTLEPVYTFSADSSAATHSHADTEGSVVPERVQEIAKAAVDSMREHAANLGVTADRSVSCACFERLSLRIANHAC